MAHTDKYFQIAYLSISSQNHELQGSCNLKGSFLIGIESEKEIKFSDSRLQSFQGAINDDYLTPAISISF